MMDSVWSGHITHCVSLLIAVHRHSRDINSKSASDKVPRTAVNARKDVLVLDLPSHGRKQRKRQTNGECVSSVVPSGFFSHIGVMSKNMHWRDGLGPLGNLCMK